VSPRSVLITGAYGLLGSWLCRSLVERGDRLVALARHVPEHSPLVLDPIPLISVCADVCDAALLETTLAKQAVDTVVHLAAQVLVGNAMRAPVSTFEANVRGTWTVLEACRRHDVQRVVVASTDKVYGPTAELPCREDLPLRPRFPYEASKAAADLIARSYWESFGLPVAVTRFTNVYGGGDHNRSRLIPGAIADALRYRAPAIRSDGSPERDFLHVDDAVAAYAAILDALDRPEGGPRGCGARGEAFNAGHGRPHAVGDVARLVCRLTGTGVEPDFQGSGTPPGEIDRQYVDSTRLTDLTGWRPRVGLEEGIRRTIDWYRGHPGSLPA